jgi:hypothetical protein
MKEQISLTRDGREEIVFQYLEHDALEWEELDTENDEETIRYAFTGHDMLECDW